MRNSSQPREATQSTMKSAGWPAASMALRSAGTSLLTEEAVSVWQTRTAVILGPSLLARSSRR